MSETASRFLEGTVFLLIVFWIGARNQDFAAVVGAASGAVTGSVKALQGQSAR